MDNFRSAFKRKVVDVRLNSFAADNYDEFRFGKAEIRDYRTSLYYLKSFVKGIIGYDKERYNSIAESLLANDLAAYVDGLELMYRNLTYNDKELLVSLIAYRTLGYSKVKLTRNNDAYWKAVKTAKTLTSSGETYDPHFIHFILEKFDLKAIGYNIQLFFTGDGIATDFIIEQYAYKTNGQTLVEARKGDVVLDIGGCWGDTALYFAHKVGDDGKVFSFEFIPDNIKLFDINTNLNPHLKRSIELVAHPVTDHTGDTIFFLDNGPGSRIETKSFNGQTGSTTTVSIDDFVLAQKVEKVDYIKMDIEGAEPMALRGAIETIKKFKPTLAISIYHSMEDFINIPRWILELNLDYEIFIGHYTIHAEETICFAKPRGR
ncbi:hypothetical protein BH10BAC4_BH10BAC4_13930 [soil metagenome]